MCDTVIASSMENISSEQMVCSALASSSQWPETSSNDYSGRTPTPINSESTTLKILFETILRPNSPLVYEKW